MALSIFHIDLAGMIERVQTALSSEIAEYEAKYKFSRDNLNQDSNLSNTNLINSTPTPTTEINTVTDENSIETLVQKQNQTNTSKEAITNLTNALTVDASNEKISIVADTSKANVEEAVTEQIFKAITESTESNSQLTKKVETIKDEENVSINEIKEEINEEISKYLDYYRNLIKRHKSNAKYKQALDELSSRFRHSFQDFDIANQDLFLNNDSMKRISSESEQKDLERRREIEQLDKELQLKMNEKVGRRV